MSTTTDEIELYDTFNVHAMQTKTRAHGPGVRFALWLQGCDLACPGCCNKQMWSFKHHNLISVEDMSEIVLQTTEESNPTTGMTIMGGEPTYQSPQLVSLINNVRRVVPDYSLLVFSGYSLEELQQCTRLGVRELLGNVDTLIDGRYDDSRRDMTTIAGSKNQRIHHVTHRLRMADFSRKDPEYLIMPGGSSIIQSGF